MGGTFRGGMQKESRTITLQNGMVNFFFFFFFKFHDFVHKHFFFKAN